MWARNKGPILRRGRKVVAVLVLLLDFTGARMVTVSEACEPSRVFFGPTLGFKAIAKLVTKQTWKTPAPRSFGARANRVSAVDVQLLRGEDRPVVAPVLSSINVAPAIERSHGTLICLWRAPRDRSPGIFPQLS
ncbi:MAG: hypothetical protein NTX64_10340 [Elusimicrobia bacterium]|nr:hypothetical protein [Elusimicrobiota bacterium]